MREQIPIKRYSAVGVGFFQYQVVPYQPTCSHTDKNEKHWNSGGCTLSCVAYSVQGLLHILDTCYIKLSFLCPCTYICLEILWFTAQSGLPIRDKKVKVLIIKTVLNQLTITNKLNINLPQVFTWFDLLKFMKSRRGCTYPRGWI